MNGLNDLRRRLGLLGQPALPGQPAWPDPPLLGGVTPPEESTPNPLLRRLGLAEQPNPPARRVDSSDGPTLDEPSEQATGANDLHRRLGLAHDTAAASSPPMQSDPTPSLWDSVDWWWETAWAMAAALEEIAAVEPGLAAELFNHDLRDLVLKAGIRV